MLEYISTSKFFETIGISQNIVLVTTGEEIANVCLLALATLSEYCCESIGKLSLIFYSAAYAKITLYFYQNDSGSFLVFLESSLVK